MNRRRVRDSRARELRNATMAPWVDLGFEVNSRHHAAEGAKVGTHFATDIGAKFPTGIGLYVRQRPKG